MTLGTAGFGKTSIIEEVVLEAVRQNGRALQFASERLRGNKEVLEAVGSSLS
jgi:hypothetical protein